jgi:HK97 family phage major capsid protein
MNKLTKARKAQFEIMRAADAKLRASGDDDPVLMSAFENAKASVEACDRQLAVTERAAKSIPVEYDPTDELTRVPHRSYALKNFRDVTGRRGVKVRADEQAHRFGKFILATLGNERAREWCSLRGIPVTKASQTEVSNTSGGALVPDEFLAQIINLKEAFGVAARESAKVTMTSDTTNMPRRTGGVTAFFVNEGTAPTESTANFDNVQLVAKKMAALVRLSSELAQDAIISVADYLIGEIAYAFASKEDDCLFLGDGTSTYGGVVGLKQAFTNTGTAGVFTATGHTTFDALTVKDLALWRGYLPAYARPGAKFFCSQSFFNQCFQALGAAGGGNTLTTLANGMGYSWLGVPIVVSQKLPKQGDTLTGNIVAYYGDMQKAVAFGQRRQMTIRRSDERYFDTDQIGIMGTERIDIVAHDVGTSSVVGPLVALKMG